MVKYANELTEVYTILNTLDEEDYNKIPKITLKAIETYMNPDYDYELDEDMELIDCNMLPGTKEFLYNIYRDYLCDPLERDIIKKRQAQDRYNAEMQKREQFNVDVFANRRKEENIDNNSIQEDDAINHLSTEENVTNVNMQMVEYKESIFTRIVNFVKNIFKRNK